MIVDHLGNEYTTLAEMCAKYGIKKSVYMERLNQGMDKEQALTTTTSVVSNRHPELGPMADRMFTIRCSLAEDKRYKDKGYETQKGFGKYLGEISGYGEPLTLMMVSSVETARRTYDLDIYRALAADLNISLDYIFGRTENPAPYPQSKGYMSYVDRVRKLLRDTPEAEMPKLKKRGVEARLALANKLNVSLDYLCEITDQMKRK